MVWSILARLCGRWWECLGPFLLRPLLPTGLLLLPPTVLRPPSALQLSPAKLLLPPTVLLSLPSVHLFLRGG